MPLVSYPGGEVCSKIVFSSSKFQNAYLSPVMNGCFIFFDHMMVPLHILSPITPIFKISLGFKQKMSQEQKILEKEIECFHTDFQIFWKMAKN